MQACAVWRDAWRISLKFQLVAFAWVPPKKGVQLGSSFIKESENGIGCFPLSRALEVNFDHGKIMKPVQA